MKKNKRMDVWLSDWDPEPSSPLPVEYRAFFFCFNRGDYYEAHDVLEHLWLQCADSNRRFYQGLIQFAGAFVHLQKHHQFPNHPTHSRRLGPSRRLFALAAKNLGGYPTLHLGLDLGRLLEMGSHWSTLAASDASPLAFHPAPVLELEPSNAAPKHTAKAPLV